MAIDTLENIYGAGDPEKGDIINSFNEWLFGRQMGGLRNLCVGGDFRQWVLTSAASIGSSVISSGLPYGFKAVADGASGTPFSLQRITGDTGAGSETQSLLLMTRAAASTSTARIHIARAFDSLSVHSPGEVQRMTLSCKLKKGADFSATSVLLNLRAHTSQIASLPLAGTELLALEGSNAIASSLISASVLTRFSRTFDVPANSQGLSIDLAWDPVGTAGASDSLRVAELQLEPGDKPTPFERLGFALELLTALSLAHTIVGDALFVGNGLSRTTTVARVRIPHRYPLRAAPTGITVSAASDFSLLNDNSAIAATAIAFVSADVGGTNVDVTVASGLTAGKAVHLVTSSANATLLLSATL